MKIGDKLLLTHVSTGTTRRCIYTRPGDCSSEEEAIFYLTQTPKRGWIELTSFVNGAFKIEDINEPYTEEEAKILSDYIKDPYKYSMHNPRYKVM